MDGGFPGKYDTTFKQGQSNHNTFYSSSKINVVYNEFLAIVKCIRKL